MNIEGDYLWDRTGEPDPEIQQLEETLGTLRYQPRALEIPADLQPDIQIRHRKFFRSFTPALAIAATIAMIVLGLGLWLALARLQRTRPSEVVQTPKKPAVVESIPSTAPSPNQNHDATASVLPDERQSPRDVTPRYRGTQSRKAGNTNQDRNAGRKDFVNNSAVAENNSQEGAAARDQLMLGLRVACAKINFAQKKAQESTNPRDLIHNQHKIG